jgi:hypothetical protein
MGEASSEVHKPTFGGYLMNILANKSDEARKLAWDSFKERFHLDLGTVSSIYTHPERKSPSCIQMEL